MRTFNHNLADSVEAIAGNNFAELWIFKSCDNGTTFTNDADCAGDPTVGPRGALGLGWQLGLIYAVVWLAVLALARISSLAGMSAAVSAPIAAALLGEMRFVPVLIALAALVLWQHRGNIARLARGEEPRVGSKA